MSSSLGDFAVEQTNDPVCVKLNVRFVGNQDDVAWDQG